MFSVKYFFVKHLSMNLISCSIFIYILFFIQVMTKHPQTTDEVKAALRDLELKVHLKEEWKGDPINVRTDFNPTWD